MYFSINKRTITHTQNERDKQKGCYPPILCSIFQNAGIQYFINFYCRIMNLEQIPQSYRHTSPLKKNGGYQQPQSVPSQYFTEPKQPVYQPQQSPNLNSLQSTQRYPRQTSPYQNYNQPSPQYNRNPQGNNNNNNPSPNNRNPSPAYRVPTGMPPNQMNPPIQKQPSNQSLLSNPNNSLNPNHQPSANQPYSQPTQTLLKPIGYQYQFVPKEYDPSNRGSQDYKPISSIANPNIQNPSPQNPSHQNPSPQNPSPQNQYPQQGTFGPQFQYHSSDSQPKLSISRYKDQYPQNNIVVHDSNQEEREQPKAQPIVIKDLEEESPIQDFKTQLRNLQNEINDQSTVDNYRFESNRNSPDRKEYEGKIKLLNQEIENWKNKFNQTENDKRKRLNDLQDQYEDQLRSCLKNQKAAYEAQLQELVRINQHLQQELANAQEANEELRGKNHELELQQYEWQTKLVEASHSKEVINQDYERLNAQHRKMKTDLDLLSAQNEYQAQRKCLDHELNQLKEKLLQRENEIDDLKNRNSQLENACVKVKKLENQLEETQYQVQLTQQSNDMLSEQLKKKASELADANQFISDQERKIKNLERSQKKEFAQKENDLLNEIRQLKLVIKEKDHDIHNLQQSIADLEQQLEILQKKMNDLHDQHEQEIKNLIDKNNDYEEQFRGNLDKKFNLLRQEIDQLQKERANVLSQMQAIQQQKYNLEKVNQQLKHELQLAVNSGKQDSHEQERRVRELSDENQEMRMKLAQTASDSFQKEQQQLGMVIIALEVEALRTRVEEQNQEIDELRRREFGSSR